MTCWLDYIVYNQWEWVGMYNQWHLPYSNDTQQFFIIFPLYCTNFFVLVIQIENVILSIAVTTWLFPKITTTTWLKNWSDFWGRKVQSLYCICLVTDVCTSQQQEQKAFEKGHSTLAAQKIVGEAIYIGRQGWCRVKSWSEKCIAAWMGTRRATGGKMSRLPAHYATIDPRSVAPIVE